MKRFVAEPIEKPLAGRATVPGDKSVSHRSVMLAALGDGESAIVGLSDGEDTHATRRAMEAMGARFEQTGPSDWRVTGVRADGLRAPGSVIDCGNSGTSIRLLSGLLAGQSFESRLTGDHSLRARPMGRVGVPLSRMGASVTGAPGRTEGEIYPPLEIRGGALTAIEYDSPIASAQVKSCVLLAGLYADGDTTVTEPRVSRDHTERMLANLGVPMTIEPPRVCVHASRWDRRLPASHYGVPGDPSSAAFLVVAGLITGARDLRISNICANHTRTGFIDALFEMGGVVTHATCPPSSGEPIVDLLVDEFSVGAMRGARIDGPLIVRAIDEIPIIAVAAAVASGVTEIRDAAELRVKESDRIATTAAMLRNLGVTVQEHPDGMTIEGRGGAPLSAGRVNAAGDHRIAMAAAVAALVADGPVVVDDVVNVATSFPGFVDTMNELGARIRVESD